MVEHHSASRPRDVVNAGWLALVSAGALLATALLAYSHAHGPPCLFRAVCGLPCPGCGMTRSLTALWHGDIVTAVRYHPLGPVVFAVLLATASVSVLYTAMPSQRVYARRLARFLGEPRLGWLAVAALLGVWLVRLLDALAGGGVFLW